MNRYRPGTLGRDFVIPRARGLKGLYLDWFGIPDVRAQLTARYLMSTLSNISFTSLVDVGCGNGMLTCLMAANYPERKFVGVDRCESSVAYAMRLAQQNGLQNVTFRTTDIEERFTDEPFDAATCLAVLQFIHDVPRLISRFASLLNSNGHLILQLPNVIGPQVLMRSARARKRLPEFNQARGGFTDVEISTLLQDAGFEVNAIQGIIKGKSVVAKEVFYLALSCNSRLSFAVCPVLNWITVYDDTYTGESAGLFISAHKNPRDCSKVSPKRDSKSQTSAVVDLS